VRLLLDDKDNVAGVGGGALVSLAGEDEFVTVRGSLRDENFEDFALLLETAAAAFASASVAGGLGLLD
jgi:hypothetical protein